MNRREFTRMTGLGALATHSFSTVASAMVSNFKHGSSIHVPLGIGNHSLRAMRPGARKLIDYAIYHKLDSVQFNTLAPFESLEEDYLTSIKDMAIDHGISIYVGVGSICERSVQFSERYGDASTLLNKGIGVARILGSPVVGVRIGNIEDRYAEGGIKPKIASVVKLMKSFRGRVQDAGIKFAFENHAGDMRSEELLELIDETGADICGAFYDPGNAIYAMEDPRLALEKMGKHIIVCQARDVMIWPSEDGALFQWTAVGEGLMDYKYQASYLSEHCPGVPIHVETISNSLRSIPFLKQAYWEGFPDLLASGITDFLKMVRMGHSIEVAEAPPGTDKKRFDMENQENEFQKSSRYLREECGVGVKNQNLFNSLI